MIDLSYKPDLHVVCGVSNHAIYIADKANALVSPVKATASAIEAVRDYMIGDIDKGKNSVGYSWNRADGKTVKLVCIIEEKEHEDVRSE